MRSKILLRIKGKRGYRSQGLLTDPDIFPMEGQEVIIDGLVCRIEMISYVMQSSRDNVSAEKQIFLKEVEEEDESELIS